jgi:hypothetical protein
MKHVTLQLTAQGVLGIHLPQSDAPLVAVANALWGPWGRGPMIAATVLSVVFPTNTVCARRARAAARQARDRARALSHPRTCNYSLRDHLRNARSIRIVSSVGTRRELRHTSGLPSLLSRGAATASWSCRDRDQAVPSAGRAIRATCCVGHHRGGPVVPAVEGVDRGVGVGLGGRDRLCATGSGTRAEKPTKVGRPAATGGPPSCINSDGRRLTEQRSLGLANG